MTERNDPCPCGSGRKYKRCCYRKDTAVNPGGRMLHLPPSARAEALAADRWEADVLALPRLYEGSDQQRPVVAMVTAGDVILHLELRDIGASEPSDLVEVLERAVASGVGLLGEWPEMVVVRRAEVADLLRPLLEARGCGVTVACPLLGLDPTARLFIRGILDEDIWPPTATPVTWAGWGLPEEDVSDFFSAAAAFHRSAPWRYLCDPPPVLVEWRDGSDPWLVAVLGGAGMPTVVGVYSDPSDYYDAGSDEGDPEMPFANIWGWVMSLAYTGRNELPRPMQREVAGAGWEIAATDAYPALMPILTPGGGLHTDLIKRFTALLRALAAFADEHGERLLERSLPLLWEGDGLVLSYGEDLDEGATLHNLPPQLEGIQELIASGELETLSDVQEWVGVRMEGYNAAPQDELSGLSPAQARALLEGGWDGGGPLKLAEDLALDDLGGASMLTNARILLQAAIDQNGLVTTQAGNLRRAFVTEMLDLMVWPDGYARRVRDSKLTLNEEDVWGLHMLRVVLEVAGLLRKRKGRFKVTQVGRRLAEEEKAGSLLAHIFRSYFRDFNIAYGERGAAAPSLQYVVPLLLGRIGTEARSWVDPDVLAERILPEDLRSDPEDPPTASDWGIARCWRRVVEPLVGFGLLEERVLSSAGESWWHRRVEVRVTPLFDRFLNFDWD